MPKSYTCICIEDEPPAVAVLQRYLENYVEFDFRAAFSNVFEAQDYLKEQVIDVIFLDINLPVMNGMDFLKGMPNKSLIVITTAYDEHAVEAFDLEVFDYLLKPYGLNRFNKTMNRLKAELTQQQADNKVTGKIQQLVVKSGNHSIKLFVEDIDYIESMREYVVLHIDKQQQISVRMSMQEILDQIGQPHFIRIHRSFIVNLNKVFAVSANEVSLKKDQLPISRTYKQQVLKNWNK